ncbi:hypothetical protein [Microvirga roseola]|uniref:hypothetical protein n=1 Tax=Microvirga roseola TaxID=2883126 RepID=UPI001E3758AC|nr:hypothetical protein [Microvirga roseola]
MGKIVFRENAGTNLAFEEIFGSHTSFTAAVFNAASFANSSEGPYQNAQLRLDGSGILATQLPDNTYFASLGSVSAAISGSATFKRI